MTTLAPATSPALRFGFSFADLYDRDGLVRLDDAFVGFVREADAPLADRLLAARKDPAAIAAKAESELRAAQAVTIVGNSVSMKNRLSSTINI